MSQVHDAIIASYQVDFENEQLVLQAQYYYGGVLREKTDILFEGYFTHSFANALKNSIILDIEECSPAYFYEREQEYMETARNYCWPINYQTPDTKAEFIESMQRNAYKVFEISSSYGLYGWVLAKGMRLQHQPLPLTADKPHPAEQ